jgi:cytoskeleton protein RodZ
VSGFGEKLRRQREMRGVSLEEISATTKIGTRSLQAIEAEDFDKLPGGIFNKGFVRAYARFLGLDEEQTVADFDLAWAQYEQARGPAALPAAEVEEEKPSISPSIWILILALVVLSLITAGFYAFQRSRNSRTDIEATANERLQASPSTEVPAVNPPPSQAASSPVQVGTSAIPPADASASAGPITSTNQPSPTPTKAKPTSDAARPSPPASSTAAASPIQLRVFARADSWLSVMADGKDLGQGTLGAQKSRSIHAQKEVRIRVGNAGGIEISFNGAPVPVNGEDGQVKELVFTANGLQR